MRVQVERAYPGSLNRRVRDAACARLGGPTVFLLHSSLGLAALRAGQDLLVAGRVPRYTPFTYQQESASRRRAMRRRKRARSKIGAF